MGSTTYSCKIWGLFQSSNLQTYEDEDALSEEWMGAIVKKNAWLDGREAVRNMHGKRYHGACHSFGHVWLQNAYFAPHIEHILQTPLTCIFFNVFRCSLIYRHYSFILCAKRRRVAVQRRDPVAQQRQFFARQREQIVGPGVPGAPPGAQRASGSPLVNHLDVFRGVRRRSVVDRRRAGLKVSNDMLTLAQPDAYHAMHDAMHPRKVRKTRNPGLLPPVPRAPGQKRVTQYRQAPEIVEDDDIGDESRMQLNNNIRVFDNEVEETARFRENTLNRSFLYSDHNHRDGRAAGEEVTEIATGVAAAVAIQSASHHQTTSNSHGVHSEYSNALHERVPKRSLLPFNTAIPTVAEPTHGPNHLRVTSPTPLLRAQQQTSTEMKEILDDLESRSPLCRQVTPIPCRQLTPIKAHAFNAEVITLESGFFSADENVGRFSHRPTKLVTPVRTQSPTCDDPAEKSRGQAEQIKSMEMETKATTFHEISSHCALHVSIRNPIAAAAEAGLEKRASIPSDTKVQRGTQTESEPEDSMVYAHLQPMSIAPLSIPPTPPYLALELPPIELLDDTLDSQ